MASYTSDTLRKEANRVYGSAVFARVPKRTDILWNLYNHALSTQTDFHILGLLADRRAICGDPSAFPDAMRSFDQSGEVGNFLISCQVQDGHVLVMSDDDWSIAANDAWMLGGIHAAKEFHLMLELPAGTATDVVRSTLANLIHPIRIPQPATPPAHPLSVTGREILGLAMYGYTITLTKAEPVFKCTDLKKCQTATFAGYHNAIKRIEEALQSSSPANGDAQISTLLGWLGV